MPAMNALTILFVTALSVLPAESTAATQPAKDLMQLERSYWLHASLATQPLRGYWAPSFPFSPTPTQTEIRNAARLLAGPYAANRLYLIYHREIELDDAQRVFAFWRKHLPTDVEIVPTLVLKMYDKAKTPVFADGEVQKLCTFFKKTVNPRRIAVYDVFPNRDQGSDLSILTASFPDGLMRVGIQPTETLKAPYVAAVQDTWSGFCHGKTNEDWRSPGFGADTLAEWIRIRNKGDRAVAWDLIVVAWDYLPTARGEYPGYDDAAKNMPLPAGRNTLAARMVLNKAKPDRLAGFSSDLFILQANARHRTHDGDEGSFYSTLKQGRRYRGYYAKAFDEVAAIYRKLKTGQMPAVPTTRPVTTGQACLPE